MALHKQDANKQDIGEEALCECHAICSFASFRVCARSRKAARRSKHEAMMGHNQWLFAYMSIFHFICSKQHTDALEATSKRIFGLQLASPSPPTLPHPTTSETTVRTAPETTCCLPTSGKGSPLSRPYCEKASEFWVWLKIIRSDRRGKPQVLAPMFPLTRATHFGTELFFEPQPPGFSPNHSSPAPTPPSWLPASRGSPRSGVLAEK